VALSAPGPARDERVPKDEGFGVAVLVAESVIDCRRRRGRTHLPTADREMSDEDALRRYVETRLHLRLVGGTLDACVRLGHAVGHTAFVSRDDCDGFEFSQKLIIRLLYAVLFHRAPRLYLVGVVRLELLCVTEFCDTRKENLVVGVRHNEVASDAYAISVADCHVSRHTGFVTDRDAVSRTDDAHAFGFGRFDFHAVEAFFRRFAGRAVAAVPDTADFLLKVAQVAV
jgi:hypothetical protein